MIAALLTSMFKTTIVDFTTSDLVTDGENSIVDGVGNSEVYKAKVGTKTS